MLVLTPNSYSFRAEALRDVLELLPLIQFTYCDMFPRVDGGVRVNIETTMPFSTLLGMVRRVPDSHVMYRTLAPTGDYAGDDPIEE